MEILTVPLAGALAHEDSRGNSGVLRPGMIQWMRAGRGIEHSEMNASADDPVHLLQIWIEPAQMGLEPTYLDRSFDFKPGQTLIAARDESEGALPIGQDARISYVRLEPGDELSLRTGAKRFGWVQWLTGAGQLGNIDVRAGDAVIASEEPELELFSQEGADALVFDLA